MNRWPGTNSLNLILNAAFSSSVRIEATPDRCEALPDADFVITSVERNRMPLWEQDFRIPQSYGFKAVYGENGGPGAMFHTLRNLNIIMPMQLD